MGLFRYDSVLMTWLVKAGNMMIVSFLWLIACLPVVTVIPAATAMYAVTVKRIRQSGTGISREFLAVFKRSLRQGIPLSLICAVSGLLLYTALDAGGQLWRENGLWAAYYAFGFLLAFIWLSMVLFLPPVLARFDCGVTVALRLALYMASRRLLRTAGMLALFVLIVLLVDFYPVTLLLLPGLYTDLVCGGTEKTVAAYCETLTDRA